MAEVRYQPQTLAETQADVDRGLRSYMLGVYNYMALGGALTAIITLAVAASPAAMVMPSATSACAIARPMSEPPPRITTVRGATVVIGRPSP